jgi:hypothetical protein
MTTVTTTMTTMTDGLFLDPSSLLVEAKYAIGGAIAKVLFCGTVGYRLQVTNISFN